ncbi:MAG TPA: phospholipase C, phosphocholine-specific [Rhizomicrobium sp.]|jgi:phospholipase C
MLSSDRRRFLKLSAGALGVSALPASIRQALAIPANNTTGTIMDVEHVVIFMQENRSFDHYFGTLNGVRGFGDPRAIRLPGGRSVWHQPSKEHTDGYVLPFYGDSSKTNAFAVGGSDQGHQPLLTARNGGRFDSWGHSGELHKRMVHFTAADLPFYYALANAFTICDAYHCSTFTQTYPNRLHMFAGCNGGGGVGGDPIMENYGEDETPSSDQTTDLPLSHGPLTYTTYAERLEAAGIDWKVYQEYDNFSDNLLSIFAPFRPAPKNSSLYRRGRSWVSEHDPDPANRTRSDGEQLVAAFRRDIESGTLPQVSWIVTGADFSEHPRHEPSKGEHVCAALIEALVANPEVFAKTVFIINYDECGGFFDHVSPPTPAFYPHEGFSTVPTDGEAKDYADKDVPNKGRTPIGLGIRVPGMVISPWSRGGFVCSEVFDHTSTIRFLERRFGVRDDNISAWRRSVCSDMTSAFDFQNPNKDWASLVLPPTADFMARVKKSLGSPNLSIPKTQALTAQDRAQRPARALPYDLATDGRVVDGKFVIDFANLGTRGAAFQVFDNSGTQGPWHFTVGAGESHQSALWHDKAAGDAAHDLAIHGPNGFFRNFRGRLSDQVTARLLHDGVGGQAILTLENHSDREQHFQIAQSDIYGGGTRRIALGAKSSHVEAWPLQASDRWYDLSVKLESTPEFLQRFAGHVETGHAGKTDPAIGVMSA